MNRIKEIAKNVTVTTSVGLWVCLIAALGLYIGSFFAPPVGEVNASVLKAGAEIFAFATLFEVREAIREGLGIKLQHGQTSIEVKDADGPQPENPEQ